jgi:hypothetical protein
MRKKSQVASWLRLRAFKQADKSMLSAKDLRQQQAHKIMMLQRRKMTIINELIPHYYVSQ